MDSRDKRPHTVTDNTPNKPSEKRHRELEVEPEERPVRRTLAFQEKGRPLQKVMVSFLVILDIVLFFLWCNKLAYVFFFFVDQSSTSSEGQVSSIPKKPKAVDFACKESCSYVGQK